MNILDLLRASNPAAVGAAITGYGPDVMTGPVAPQRPPQAAIDALGGQNFPAPAQPAPGGSVLAVIDPALQKRQQEEKGLLDQVAQTLTSGGLTADGKGRSKWGAFAHGMASALNHQGAARSKSEQAKYERALKERDFGLKKQAADDTRSYRERRLSLDERKQTWNETPDAPGTDGSIAAWRERMADLREQDAMQRRLGLTPAGRNAMSRSQYEEAERRYEEWEKAPERRWNRRAAAAPAQPAGSTNPQAASQPQPQAAPGVPPGPVPSNPAPATAPAQTSQAPRQSGATPPMEGARRAPDGNWYVQQNGKWFKVEQ